MERPSSPSAQPVPVPAHPVIYCLEILEHNGQWLPKDGVIYQYEHDVQRALLAAIGSNQWDARYRYRAYRAVGEPYYMKVEYIEGDQAEEV